MRIDPIELTQQLVRLNTVNPPGQELKAFLLIEGLLDRAGFKVQRIPFGDNRCNLVADLPGIADSPRRCFTGHLDTVPLGDAPWAVDPFSGLIRGGRLHGRGASDMKGGVAALVSAAISASHAQGPYPIRLILTAGEETGCEGARDLVGKFPLGSAQFLLVAEPTLNRVCSGHKGALWLKVRWRGVSAHGSMPSLGDNAVVRASEVIASLSHMAFLRETHPMLEYATLNVGYLTGGKTFNVVPDHAEAGIDIRTLPNQQHAHVVHELRTACGPDATVEVVLSLDGVATPPENGWVQEMHRIAREATCERTNVAYLPYFTDAAVLAPALGHPPVVIVGPGDPGQAHQTDEACDVGQIRTAAQIYLQCMVTDFCAHAGRSAELH